MNDFISQYGLCILLCAIGLFFVIMTYGAYFSGRSGVPFIGGLLIVIGFLTTPVRWPALFGLIDPGYWEIPYFIIVGSIRNKRFAKVYSERDLAEKTTDDLKRVRIHIPETNEELIRPYITRHIYELRIPELFFSVCIDKAGKRFILVDKCKRGAEIEISEFDEGRITLTALKADKADMTVEIEITDSVNN